MAEERRQCRRLLTRARSLAGWTRERVSMKGFPVDVRHHAITVAVGGGRGGGRGHRADPLVASGNGGGLFAFARVGRQLRLSWRATLR